MAHTFEESRHDSMADKEINFDDAVESVTEDTESATHEDIVSSNRQPDDLEKADPNVTAPEPLRKTITAQDWNGPDDPENPLNWYGRAWLPRAIPILTPFAGVSRRRPTILPLPPALAFQ
jgi:hypothetical protein